MHIWICMPAILIIASIYFPPAWKTCGYLTRGGKKLKRWSRALSREREIGEWTVALMMAISLSINRSFKYGVAFLESKAVSLCMLQEHMKWSLETIKQTQQTGSLYIYIYITDSSCFVYMHAYGIRWLGGSGELLENGMKSKFKIWSIFELLPIWTVRDCLIDMFKV